MSGRRKEIAPDRVAEGRRLYENTLTPVREIATMMGISRNTLDNRIAEWKWQRRYYIRVEATPAPAPDAVPAASVPALLPAEIGAAPAVPAELSAHFAARLVRIIDGQCDVIDRTLRVLNPADASEAERTTRTLAVISRTVQEIKVTALSAGPPHDETDDDPVPRDIDEFRNELARRIHTLIDAQQSTESCGDGNAVRGNVGERA
jgi:DNA-binding Lrp family transcriptional regulator